MPDVHRAAFIILLTVGTSAVLPGLAPAQPQEAVLEYPVRLLDAHNGDTGCWRGMDADGNWLGPGSELGSVVVPRDWLVGPPPSELSAVTIPEDHWVNLAFAGRIVDARGADILVLESGTMGEQALVFLTDGADQEYVVALAEAERTNRPDISRIEIDLAGQPIPFVARGVRIVGIDLGGGSPGFDLASVQARVSRECGPKTCCPNPPGGAVDIEPDVRLNWIPASAAGWQRIYLGTVASQVSSAAAEALLAIQPADANSFQPQLELGKTYYWRVDTAAPTDANVFQAGDVWSFSVTDHRVIDDFQSYPDTESLQDCWKCPSLSAVQLGAASSQTCEFFMDFDYLYDASSWPFAFRRLNPPQDWTRMGERVLQVLLRGDLPDPAGGELFIGLTDGIHEQMVCYVGSTSIGDSTDWHAWRIALGDFSDLDLAHVQGMVIGIRPTSVEAGQSYSGVISIRDISLYPALCLKDRRPQGDIDGDCAVDYRDVEQMAAEWLRPRVRSYAVVEPNEPVLWYAFDGNANDNTGAAHGQVQGRTTYGPGVHGQAIHFSYQGDAVVIPDAAHVFAGIGEAITIAFWQYGDDSSHLNDTICCSNYEYGKSNPAIAINLGCWQNPGQYRWDCGDPWSLDNRLAGRHRDKREWAGRWSHWVFTKDIRPGRAGRTGRMAIYLNGQLYDSRAGTDSPITNITSFEIGTGWYGRYDGLIDDFRIYDYALSPAEAAWLATDGTGTIEDPTPSPADLNASGRTDLRDFALLASQWLQDTLWP
jgi:hypothetical protein